MKQIQKIEVAKFGKTPIFLENGIFKATYGGVDYEAESLDNIKRQLSDSSFKEESGDYFIICYDGLRKAVALRSYIDKYSGKKFIVIEETDKYGSKKNIQAHSKSLLLATPELNEIYNKQKEMVEEGWSLIRKGENLYKTVINKK